MVKQLSADDADPVDQFDEPLNAAFAAALTDELDSAGFISGTGRCAAFAEFMGCTRSHAFKILKGQSFPTIRKLFLLRSLGVSLDRIVDKSNNVRPLTKTVYLAGKPVSAIVEAGISGQSCGAALIPHDAGYELIPVGRDTKLSNDAIPIRVLRFDVNDTLAIVEDDMNTLESLARAMSDAFHTVPFSCAQSFLDELTGNDTYKAILMDWRLPDMNGEDLVARIREKTNAPIYILTGDETAGLSISRALICNDVYYIAKPVEIGILIQLLLNAIRRADMGK